MILSKWVHTNYRTILEEQQQKSCYKGDKSHWISNDIKTRHWSKNVYTNFDIIHDHIPQYNPSNHLNKPVALPFYSSTPSPNVTLP